MWHNITHKKPQQMTCSITFEFGTKLQACNMRKGRHLPALWVQYFRCTSVFPSKLCPSVCALGAIFSLHICHSFQALPKCSLHLETLDKCRNGGAAVTTPLRRWMAPRMSSPRPARYHIRLSPVTPPTIYLVAWATFESIVSSFISSARLTRARHLRIRPLIIRWARSK